MLYLIKLKNLLRSNKYAVALLMFITGYVIFFTIIIKYESVLNDETILKGQIINYSFKEDKLSLTIKTKEKIIANYYIENQKEKDKLQKLIKFGDYIVIKGNLKELSNNTIPNTFNYKKYLYNKKIHKTFLIEEFEIYKNNSWYYKIKNALYKKANSLEDTSNYILALLLGNKSDLENEVYSSFKNNGILHLFAISGMHISIFISLLNRILKKVPEVARKLIIIAFSCFYALIVNMPASILRVCTFLTLEYLFKLFNIKISKPKILLYSACVLIIFNPFYVYDLGFIYSYVLMFFIYSFPIKSKNKILNLLKLSILTFLASVPITIFNFYKINILSIIINIICVPLVSSIVFPLVIGTFLCKYLEPVLKLSLDILEKINLLFDEMDFLTITISKPTILIIIVYYGVLYMFLKNTNIKLYITFIIILLMLYFKKFVNFDYQIYFLDVGQGDSTILVTPVKNKVIMIDTGGKINYSNKDIKKSSYHVSDNVIVFLNSLGIDEMDLLVITHGDFDHMGEAINLVNNFKVENVIFNCGEFNELEQELIKVLEKKKIPYYSCINELNVDDNKLYFLNNKDYNNENDNSSVIYTKFNNHKFLFMGDAGVEVEEDILEKYNLQNIDVLKVGHHGSKTSSSEKFINEINPKYSIMSVGKNNRYGHPNDSVLDNLKDSKIYRTDQVGSIMFKIKNNKLQIETCPP
ncbi:MAG: DNA internalization-related competence protein ComEC/Rec2 [Bacilli bacterium]|nr:DNA internalization-related competence protein ComEC/Rec2 [Bacilli bacterium]